MWKRDSQLISSGNDSTNVIAGRDVNLYFQGNVPKDFVDQKIEEEVERLRKSRFFVEFDRVNLSLRLGGRLAEGDLSGGSDESRARALALCARLLSRSDELGRAEDLLKIAYSLGDFAEIKIAEAFVTSQNGDKAGALSLLARIDSDASHSAGLMIVSNHDGVESALGWMHDSGYSVESLDSDGKSFLLSQQLQLGRWDEVALTADALSEADFDRTPILHHLAALAALIPTIPQDFRAIVLSQVPYEAREFPLSTDVVSMSARRAAHKHFLRAVEAAQKLHCPQAARVDDEYALWLELRDPVQSAHGKSRLERKLRDPNTALGFVRYAIMFGIKLDLSAVERDIERSIAINGGVTVDSAVARFAISFMQSSPEGVASYIARYQHQLAAHIDVKLLQYRQIEMLSRAGLTEKAGELLDQLIQDGLPKDQEHHLRGIIFGSKGGDPITPCKEQYEATQSLGDLINLVAELENHHRWDELCEFGGILFEKTRSLGDAERLVNALNIACKSEVLVGFLKENSYLLSQSRNLRMSYAWGLYQEGEFLESLATLADLKEVVDDPNYRALQVNLGIATGDWASLSAYIVDECRNKDSRNAHDLIGAAQLALHLGSPQAKDLVFEAAAKADGDAAVLSAAYFIATSAGWEDDPQVFQWLAKAAERSEGGGPLQRVSLKDILDKKPEWDRRESETWRLLAQGQMPIFLAAQSLNRTLVDFTTFPALANLGQLDPRRRSAVPAYSGRRLPLEFDVRKKVAALDATALLTLSFLNVLDIALDAFRAVYIPHSTLRWLFEERQKAAFHQPSRIASARKVRDLMATGYLEKFTPCTFASSDLSDQIGDELAALIAEAENVREGEDSQRVVVRCAPVHRISSLMEEEADLSSHSAVLSSCFAVVEKLRQKGQITADEKERARAYLQLQEKPWPNQPDIRDGATLYLDDLAMAYLLHLGMLGRFRSAGLKVVASPRAVSEADALISYDRISEEAMNIIERIRSSLSSRIRSGQVRISRRCNFDESGESSISEHPSIGILAAAPYCDVAIVDDRFLNQHENIDSRGVKLPVFSTLDLLDAFVAAGFVSQGSRLEYRTQLRRAGYLFVPLNVDELERWLKESTVENGVVVETAELKAIREAVLLIRMSDWLMLPQEAPWLDVTIKTFVQVLRSLWVDGADIEEVIARSNWLAEQADIRSWAHSLAPDHADSVVRVGRAAHILMLLMPLSGVHEGVLDSYWNWLQGRILAPLQEQFPEVYEWLVRWHANCLAEMVKADSLMAENS